MKGLNLYKEIRCNSAGSSIDKERQAIGIWPFLYSRRRAPATDSSAQAPGLVSWGQTHQTT